VPFVSSRPVSHPLARCVAPLLMTAAISALTATAVAANEGLTTASFTPTAPAERGTVSSHPDASTLRLALEQYRRGNTSGGDAHAANLTTDEGKVAAEWIAMRTAGRSLGFERTNAFLTNFPDMPMRMSVERRAEDALMIERAKPERVLAFFKDRTPQSSNGRAILAISLQKSGDTHKAEELAFQAYRDRSITRDVAEALEATFPDLLGASQKALRAHRLILNKQKEQGLQLAGKLGVEQIKLAHVVAFAAHKGADLGPLNSVDPALQKHPSFILAKAQVLRRMDRLSDARDTLMLLPRDAALLADADEVWTERRILTRRLLDAQDPAGAYRVVAEHLARSPGRQAEAEFHAGWIALRYLHYPQSAFMHFEVSARIAETPQAKARAAYWSGRAEEAGALSPNGDQGQESYRLAASYPATYYGQLAAGRILKPRLDLPAQSSGLAETIAFNQSLPARLANLLLEAGAKEHLFPAALDYIRHRASAAEADLLIRPFVEAKDAPSVLTLGRHATLRGLPLEQHAFPTFGIPAYQALPGSAEKAMVYAIARQESAFQAKAVSHANARGLMQMLPSTAARTAQRFKVSFSANRLTEDPAFCAQLGAAHLGELMEETKGSLVMTFAAYNAGGHRVREWIAAFGDPRDPATDVVDWVERIPFYETRNYVQRIMENLQTYRARLDGNQSALLIQRDMETGRR
jgi:soluble lytic murein transglycosylase